MAKKGLNLAGLEQPDKGFLLTDGHHNSDKIGQRDLSLLLEEAYGRQWDTGLYRKLLLACIPDKPLALQIAGNPEKDLLGRIKDIQFYSQ
ncbi:hypothetical protein [Leptospirillum ferriphilum]|uniref:Uncharacterized protein n=1 Tax=Leptospirillum ferriphilum TaxID=178606 RepID=A0A2I2MFD5_9BACT|nr:hypothetical protein [Leptospirillum ferriphilum]